MPAHMSGLIATVIFSATGVCPAEALPQSAIITKASNNRVIEFSRFAATRLARSPVRV